MTVMNLKSRRFENLHFGPLYLCPLLAFTRCHYHVHYCVVGVAPMVSFYIRTPLLSYNIKTKTWHQILYARILSYTKYT